MYILYHIPSEEMFEKVFSTPEEIQNHLKTNKMTRTHFAVLQLHEAAPYTLEQHTKEKYRIKTYELLHDTPLVFVCDMRRCSDVFIGNMTFVPEIRPSRIGYYIDFEDHEEYDISSGKLYTVSYAYSIDCMKEYVDETDLL